MTRAMTRDGRSFRGPVLVKLPSFAPLPAGRCCRAQSLVSWCWLLLVGAGKASRQPDDAAALRCLESLLDDRASGDPVGLPAQIGRGASFRRSIENRLVTLRNGTAAISLR